MLCTISWVSVAIDRDSSTHSLRFCVICVIVGFRVAYFDIVGIMGTCT